jgi:hypothetical protein
VFRVYKRVLCQMKQYITHEGVLDAKLLELIMRQLAETETQTLQNRGNVRQFMHLLHIGLKTCARGGKKFPAALHVLQYFETFCMLPHMMKLCVSTKSNI